MATRTHTDAHTRRLLVILALAAVLGGAAVIAAVAATAGDTASQDEKARQQNAAEHPRAGQLPKPDPAMSRPAEQPEPAWPAGIFQDREAPMPASQFQAVNRWQGEVGNRRLAVYAGHQGTDPTRGLLLIFSYNNKSIDAQAKLIERPGDGALRILSANGHVLTIGSNSGRQYRYDAATGQLS
jgi:hypothetical protein